MDKQNSIPGFDFVHGASKVMFVIPLLIIFVALILKAQQSIPFLNAKAKITPSPSPVAAALEPSPSAKIKLDLKGPYFCEYSAKTQSAIASIKNKNIMLQMKGERKDNVLVKGDCYYKWNTGEFTGDKMCGISTYISLYETISAVSGGMDLGTLLSFSQMSDVKTASISADFLQKTVESCKKVEVNDSVFTVPTTIRFKETAAPTGAAGASSDPTGSLGGLGGLLNSLGK